MKMEDKINMPEQFDQEDGLFKFEKRMKER